MKIKLFWLGVSLLAAAGLIMPAQAQKSPSEWAQIQLDYICQEKVGLLARFTDKLHGIARQAAADPRVLSFFEMNRQYFSAVQAGGVPDSLSREIQALRKGFDPYYISQYAAFYDMLFVNTSGFAFYTIRKEGDAHAHLPGNISRFGNLGSVLAQKPEQEAFVDFYQYLPSGEPAAFFLEPVYQSRELTGWIVLQCAVNKLNSIFAATDEMGQTGEAFLVNQEGLMLTESYFKGESTILKQHLSEQNVRPKFQARSGRRTVVDYRGATALTSFAVVEFLKTRWLVVAKIDQDETITAHYKTHPRYYDNHLLARLRTLDRPPVTDKLPFASQNPLRVDMDEFLKASDNQQLETWGVSTCTAFLATIPTRFAYLAHISPRDKVYGGNSTVLIQQISNKIKQFDVYPFQRREVQFVVIAPHLESLPAILHQLTQEGFFLSQIWVGYHGNALSAAVISDYKNGGLAIRWTLPGKQAPDSGGLAQCTNVGEMVKALLDD